MASDGDGNGDGDGDGDYVRQASLDPDTPSSHPSHHNLGFHFVCEIAKSPLNESLGYRECGGGGGVENTLSLFATNRTFRVLGESLHRTVLTEVVLTSADMPSPSRCR